MSRCPSLTALLSVVLAAALGHAQTPAAPHPLTLDGIFKFQDVGDPQVSPDGLWVAYTLSRIDTDADKRLTDIWMVSWDGSQDIRLTYGQDTSASSPRWSPDGQYL